MPSLDRRIVVRSTGTRPDEHGEPEPVNTDISVWATRVDLSQSDKEEAGGVLDLPARRYVIRYRRDIAEAPTSQLSIVDGDLTLNATNVIDAPDRGERRRFIVIECTGEELA